MNNSSSLELRRRIDVIESAYEYMLAYAAQGFESNADSNQADDIRMHLAAMDDALLGLNTIVGAVAELADGEATRHYQSFLDALSHDANKAQGAVRLALGRAGISSQLIDNLNASIHLRALLTDLFLLDEAFKN